MSVRAQIHTATFQEFEAYSAAVEGADLQFTLVNLLQPLWSTLQFTMPDSIHVQCGSEGSPTIAEGAIREDGHTVLVQDSGTWRANGSAASHESTLLLPPGAEFCIATERAHHWMSVFVPNEILASLLPESVLSNSGVTGGRVLGAGGAMGELWRLAQGFVANAMREPSIGQAEASLRAFRESLLASFSRLWGSEAREASARGRPAAVDFAVIASVVELIEDLPELMVTPGDLVAASGLPERSLRAGFQRYFGVSPQKYLQIRRLHQARAILLDPLRSETTVSQVAASLGMWDLGRFAARYRSLFGELPSTTLRRTGVRG